MGTPHQGTNSVSRRKLMSTFTFIFVATDDKILNNLKRDSEWLQQQLGQYAQISSDFVTNLAYETYETATCLGQKIMVIFPNSCLIVC